MTYRVKNEAFRHESRLRNVSVLVAAVCTFLAVGLGYGWIAWALAVVTALLLVAAVNYSKPVKLFMTDDPAPWPPGSEWRRYQVCKAVPFEDGWIVYGHRVW